MGGTFGVLTDTVQKADGALIETAWGWVNLRVRSVDGSCVVVGCLDFCFPEIELRGRHTRNLIKSRKWNSKAVGCHRVTQSGDPSPIP